MTARYPQGAGVALFDCEPRHARPAPPQRPTSPRPETATERFDRQTPDRTAPGYCYHTYHNSPGKTGRTIYQAGR